MPAIREIRIVSDLLGNISKRDRWSGTQDFSFDKAGQEWAGVVVPTWIASLTTPSVGRLHTETTERQAGDHNRRTAVQPHASSKSAIDCTNANLAAIDVRGLMNPPEDPEKGIGHKMLQKEHNVPILLSLMGLIWRLSLSICL
jgi:hypothetical protein